MIIKSLIVLLASLFLFACSPKKEVTFSDDSTSDITPYVDTFASTTINLSKTLPLNQEFEVKYKTFSPDSVGIAHFKARSVKEVTSVADRTPQEGKKLILVEISVQGNIKNAGNPSTFNQVGDTPSPQFVIIDKDNNLSYVEETYYSDAYTAQKKLFELSKITLDHDKWVNTALVFQIDSSLTPDLAFRFINDQGNTEFYDIAQ